MPIDDRKNRIKSFLQVKQLFQKNPALALFQTEQRVRKDIEDAFKDIRERQEHELQEARKKALEETREAFVKIKPQMKGVQGVQGEPGPEPSDTRLAALIKRVLGNSKELLDAAAARVFEKNKNTFIQALRGIFLEHKEELRGAQGEKGEPAEELSGEAIVSKLTDLPEEEKLPQTAVKGLEDFLNSLSKRLSNARSRQSGGGGHEQIVDDLSSQTDGNTKSFTLKVRARPNTVMLYGTDFPQNYRPVIDFTENTDGRGTTLTSAVQAPSEEATLVAVYQKKED